MESADAGMSQHDVAIGVSSDDQDLNAIGRRGAVEVMVIRVVDDEDVLENGSVLQDCEDWDFRHFVTELVLGIGSHC